MKTTALVQSLDRGLELLEAVAAHPAGLTLAELAEFLEVSQPAAFNLASTLANRGYLVKTPRPVRYRLGRTVMDLTRSYLASGGEETREQALLELGTRIKRGAVVIVEVHAGSFMYTMRLDAARPRMLQRGMQHIPAPYHMATPLCLMAYLDADARAAVEAVYPFHELARRLWESEAQLDEFLRGVRESGHVLITEPGPWRTAAPILNAAGEVIAALGMSTPAADEMTPAELTALAQDVRSAATRLSQAP